MTPISDNNSLPPHHKSLTNMNMETPDSETPDPLEKLLKSMRPARLSDDFLNRLNTAMVESASQPENVLTLETYPRKTSAKSPFVAHKWGWAAALAVLGAASALLLTENPESNPGLAHSDSTPDNPVTYDSPRPNGTENLFPVAYDGFGSSANTMPKKSINQRPVWIKESPHKFIQSNYTKTIQGKDSAGRTIEITIPATRYIVVPDEAY